MLTLSTQNDRATQQQVAGRGNPITTGAISANPGRFFYARYLLWRLVLGTLCRGRFPVAGFPPQYLAATIPVVENDLVASNLLQELIPCL